MSELSPEELFMLESFEAEEVFEPEPEPATEKLDEDEIRRRKRIIEPPFLVTDDQIKDALDKTFKDGRYCATWNEVLYHLPCRGQTVSGNAVWFYCRTSKEYSNYNWDSVRKLTPSEKAKRQ